MPSRADSETAAGVWELGGREWRFVDTAGIRRRVHQTRWSDFYASLRTQTALEKAEVVVVLMMVSIPRG